MQTRFIMTAFGKDRPGIVADVTAVLYELGCNLEETSMSLLADEFTLNLLFSGNRPRLADALAKACQILEQDKDVFAFIRPLPERQATETGRSLPCTLHVEGMDQAGIVFKVSSLLAGLHLNIIDLKSAVRPAPESGSSVYLMDIHALAPPDTDFTAVENRLTDVAEELGVEISFAR